MFEEEESLALFPEERVTEEGTQVEPAAEQTASQESALEDPVVIVPLDPAEEEPERREQYTTIIEESNPIVSLEAPGQVAIEEYAEEEAAVGPDPTVPEGNSATTEEPGAPKEDESVVSDTEEEGQGETAAEETTPALEEAVIVFVEPTSEDAAPEDLILIIPLEDTEEEDTGDNVVSSDTLGTVLEESDTDVVTSVTETPSENDTVETALDPGGEVPEDATEAPDVTEILTESPIEAVKAPLAHAVFEARIVPAPREGVWATQFIPKGQRFGPFVGEKKKRSQVTSNVYMWEVYFPARGWMCVDATDPMKGNWLRYVNWARSAEEQNLFPLEINRAIYYNPIGPGEELLVWYTVEDNPEITAALEEERASSQSRTNSPRAKRARRKLLERARQAGLGGFKKTSVTKPTAKEMWDGEEGLKEEDERPSAVGPSQEPQETHPMRNTDCRDVEDMSTVMTRRGNGEEEEEDADDSEEQTARRSPAADSIQSKQPGSLLTRGEESHKDPQGKVESSSLAGQEPQVDPDPDLDPDPDGDLEGDPHGESHPCQHCERHFSTRQGLERHIHIHAITNQQTQLFKCRYCSKSFGSQVGRRRHERRHESGLKKRPGSLAGTASLLSPVMQTDGSSPDCTSPTSHYIAIGSQVTGGPLHNSEMQKKESGPYADRPFILDENGESKELHPCKYCNKAFGTHTNMRRHQRRIHERHLLPKGVRRKGMMLQEASVQKQQQQQQQPDESPSISPPPVYVPSADTEDEVDRDDYAVDISKNISENLSFYIDGKIVSTSSVSSCEVIEVDSRSAALFGLDTVIISPNQISQALKVEGRTGVVKQLSNIGQPATKRRTSTPPFVPSLKVEMESASLAASSSSSSSSTSSSSNLLVGGLFQQAADSSAFQREKTVYLSPKLKQLLQTQDIQKSTLTLITESHRLASPLSVTQLPGASGRFKRRTSSPPSSPQLSPACKSESCKPEAVSSFALKVPKLESFSASPPGSLLDKEEGDGLNLSDDNAHGQTSSNSGGNSCNQQPLDLSNSVTRRRDSSSKVLGDSALDLSFQRKSNAEPELKGGPAPQPLIKKRKPNTSMLEKVLMNDYLGLPLPGDEAPVAGANLSCFHSRSPSTATESAHPSPPSLTPVTMNPSSPGNSSGTSPTPPPPLLPTIPSSPAMPSSPLSQPSDASVQRSLPVLSPKMSPRSVEHHPPSDSEDNLLAEDDKDEEGNRSSEPRDFPNTPLKDPVRSSASLSPPEPTSMDLPAVEEDVSLTASSAALANGKMNQNRDSIPEEPLAALSPQPESSSSSSSSPPPASPTLVLQSVPQIKIKEEPESCMDEPPVPNHAPLDAADSSPRPVAPDKASDQTSVAEEGDSTYSKTFVCNVCEEPFDSIQELSGHITEHAADRPFKCEFCVQLFGDAPALLAHRTALHGVGRIFVCSVCSKEFAFLCNLQQHQKDLHPNESCSHATVESGKLRPQNYTDPSRAKEESSPSTPAPAPEAADEAAPHSDADVAKEEPDVNGNHTEDAAEDPNEDPNEELYTTIKIMASEGGKPKAPDVRLGINQHYPSYKPPPFPYHSRSHAGSVASATNFTTHNIPQTFSTAIRCTKCGNSFDNMPELHKHILACASASDKKRYTPKKNPIPLKQIVKSPNGVVSTSAAIAGQSPFRRMGQPKRLNFNQDTNGKTKMSALSKKKNQLVQKAITQKNKAATSAKKATVKVEEELASNVCPHCSREFTYPASLSKHMAVSCPMKPVVKKGKKSLAEVKKEAASAGDKYIKLRKKASDFEIPQTEREPKPLGKTRARSSGAADPEPAPAHRGKPAAPLGRLKRPASFPAPVSASKKAKKGHVQSLPPSPSDPDAPGVTAHQRPAVRMQRVGKEAAPKRLAKSPPPAQQLKREERFSLRMRERVGGPVTRSLQMVSAAPSVEVKTEEPPTQEPKETQGF
ncbi:PR domain zinc finger protein 2 [Liparis tanakae]|uniref:PR domain zinc finger protein 2 n=1 Tax=Liparis tanakae TaxID=230148 RepID=A0A4Z2J120_9TELE|nr:PR domain zinc finger protein 2 [Liparis tanakae]